MTQSTNGQSIAIVFDKSSNSNAEFDIEVMKLKSGGQVGPSEFLDAKNGHATFDINTINSNEIDCISLVIVRTDTLERLSNSGGYTIQAIVR